MKLRFNGHLFQMEEMDARVEEDDASSRQFRSRVFKSPRAVGKAMATGTRVAGWDNYSKSKEILFNSRDAFGISRGRCRCGRCAAFQNDGRAQCQRCNCAGNLHKRLSYFQGQLQVLPGNRTNITKDPVRVSVSIQTSPNSESYEESSSPSESDTAEVQEQTPSGLYSDEERSRIDDWRKKLQFLLLNDEFEKGRVLCETMIKEMKGKSKNHWMPPLIHRAKFLLDWVKSSFKNLGAVASRISLARKDADCVLQEGSQDEFLCALAYAIEGEVDQKSGHFSIAKKKLIKAKDLLGGFNKEIALIWGLDLSSRVESNLNVIKWASKLQTSAEESLREHKPSNCLKKVNELLKETPISAKALSLKSEALLQLRRVQETLNFCSMVLSSTNMEAEARLYANISSVRARALYLQGDLNGAVKTLQGASASNLDRSDKAKIMAWQKMLDLKEKGNLAFSKTDFKKAIQCYTDCLAIDRTSAKFQAILFCNRGAAYLALKNFKRCLNDCDAALKLDPGYHKALWRRARAGASCESKSALKQARDNYEKLFRIDPAYRKTCDQELKNLNARLDTFEKKNDPRPAPTERSNAAKIPRQDWKSKQDDFWRNWFHNRNSRPRTAEARENKIPNSRSGWGTRKRTSSSTSNEWVDSEGKVKDFYRALQLRENGKVDRISIKKAFHRLALQYHPDKNQGQSDMLKRSREVQFKQISEAYAVLGNDEKRAQYDKFRRFMP